MCELCTLPPADTPRTFFPVNTVGVQPIMVPDHRTVFPFPLFNFTQIVNQQSQIVSVCVSDRKMFFIQRWCLNPVQTSRIWPIEQHAQDLAYCIIFHSSGKMTVTKTIRSIKLYTSALSPPFVLVINCHRS